MEELFTQTRANSDHAGQAKNVFAQVVDGSRKTAALVNRIDNSTTEQVQGLDQIKQALAELNDLT